MKDSAGNTGTVNCSVSVAPPSTPPQLVVLKTPDSATITAGSTAGFTVTISNTGGSTATGLALSDPLPRGETNFSTGRFLSGRVFGGDNHDMQLVSGLTLHAPIMNTATGGGANVSSSSSSATITVNRPFLPSAHFE